MARIESKVYVHPDDGVITPACSGEEKPFTVNGVRWQYVWQSSTGLHGYHNLDTDIITWHRSFHPSFNPKFEGEVDCFVAFDYIPDPIMAWH